MARAENKRYRGACSADRIASGGPSMGKKDWTESL